MPNEALVGDALNASPVEVLQTGIDDLFRSAQERLALWTASRLLSGGARFPADKWLLSSATQKLIRRGQGEQAARVALALDRLDSHYLPRRLPVIAFEDVGVGDLASCFDTLNFFRKQRFPAAMPERERRSVLANLVVRLARSVKSRTACDIYCLAHADQAAAAAAARFARSSERCLVAMASDRSAAVTSRALALHLLTGMSIREGRWPRTLSRFNERGLRAVVEKLGLTEVLAWMMIEGRNTCGLASMLPLVLEVIPDAHVTTATQEPPEKLIAGLPAYAADMYTRAGKAAIADFTRALRERHSLLFQALPGTRQHARLVGMALFHCEGSKLDRWLENSGTAEYRNKIEEVELRMLGWPEPELPSRLYSLLERERRLLWQIRHSHLRVGYGMRRSGE